MMARVIRDFSDGFFERLSSESKKILLDGRYYLSRQSYERIRPVRHIPQV
jgi:hypothetical protein